MKFLDEPRLAFWSNFLRSVELGDRVLSVRMEAFSCKKAGDDKRFSKALEQHIMDMSTSAAASPGKITYGTSPSFGLLTEPHVRRTLVDLICTLNATFPDYDFSTMTPDHFEKETGTITVQNKVNAALAEISVINNCSFLENMWADIDTVMKLKDCEVYSYSPDMEGDPLSEGCLWSFNHFFFSKSLKRILFLHCTAKSKLHLMEEVDDDDSDADDQDTYLDDRADEGVLGDMDMEDGIDMEPPGGDDDSDSMN